MGKLIRVLFSNVSLTLKNLRTILFSSTAVIVLFPDGDRIRFFVANKTGEELLCKMRGRRYYRVRLADSPLQNGHLVRIEKGKRLEYYYCRLDMALRMPVQMVPATLSNWLALLWRASSFLMI